MGGNYKISIADGATVVLRDATINGTHGMNYQWAGITCKGDATIVLEGENRVKGFMDEYPGILIPKDKTLTIRGLGSLTTLTSNGWGSAGIGGGYQIPCGNIVIEGGIITATGGEHATGVGGGRNTSCGTITITGGKVTATGGEGVRPSDEVRTAAAARLPSAVRCYGTALTIRTVEDPSSHSIRTRMTKATTG